MPLAYRDDENWQYLGHHQPNAHRFLKHGSPLKITKITPKYMERWMRIPLLVLILFAH